MLIEYVDDKGKTTISNRNNFLNLLDTLDAHEPIENLDRLNESIQENNYYKALKAGQEFELAEIKDQEGEIIQEKQNFKISLINERDKKIILDKAVLKTPRTDFSKSVYNALYFDRDQQEFSYGEFPKLLRKQGYKRILTEEDDLQAIIKKQEEAYKEEMNGFMADATEDKKELFNAVADLKKYSFTPPKPGEEQTVIFRDKGGNRREGILSSEDGKYYLTEKNKKTDLEALMTAGVPISLAAAPAAKTTGGFQRRELNRASLVDMANKGDINDQEEEEAEAPNPAEAELEAGQEPQPQEPQAPQPKTKDKLTSKAKEEALAYSEIKNVGGMDKNERGFLRSIWADTRLITLNDLWEMGKTMWEYYNRRFERRQKERYSGMGEDLPFFGPEMKRINQSAENEEVNQFKDFLEQSGVFEVQERLKKTGNKDEMKASFTVLSEKGQLRWDDIDMWRNINKFVHPSLAIPIPSNGDPYTAKSATDPRTGFDFLRGALDSLWGEGSYNDWYNRNNSSFESKLKEYYNEGMALESIEGGHAAKLAVLLAAHKRGEYVDPHQYEGLITHAIEAGKSSMQAKLYYIIEGIGAVNMHGKTILAFERMGSINSNNLTIFPLLEYLTSSHKRKDGKAHKYTMHDFQHFVNEFDGGDPQNPARCKPNQNVDSFLWERVLTSNETHTRIRKVARNMEQLDHDDMFAYMPPLDEEGMNSVCQAATGRKKYLTIEGYANVFPGFNQYIRTLGEVGDKNKLTEAIISYVRFESIMTDKYEKEKGDLYARLSDQVLDKGTVVSPSVPPRAFIKQLNQLVKKIAEAYSDTEAGQQLLNTIETMNTYVEDPIANNDDKAIQREVDAALRSFGRDFKATVQQDNGERMNRAVVGANLTGMPFTDDATRDRAKAEIAASGFDE